LFLGDAVVDGIDYAADGAAAIEQGSRSAHDVDLFNDQRVDTDRMVETETGGIEDADTILHDAYAFAVEAADYRT